MLSSAYKGNGKSGNILFNKVPWQQSVLNAHLDERHIRDLCSVCPEPAVLHNQVAALMLPFLHVKELQVTFRYFWQKVNIEKGERRQNIATLERLTD